MTAGQVIAGIIVLALGSWYFDHYKRARRRMDSAALSVGIRRLPFETNAALAERIRAWRHYFGGHVQS